MNSSQYNTEFVSSNLFDERVVNPPRILSSAHFLELTQFLKEHKGILKIEYSELINLVSLIKRSIPISPIAHIAPTAPIAPISPTTLPNPPKLLRTSRNYPFFTILRKVDNLPNDLSYLELKVLAEFLDDHKTISFINYYTLCRLVNLDPQTPTTKPNNLVCPNAPSRSGKVTEYDTVVPFIPLSSQDKPERPNSPTHSSTFHYHSFGDDIVLDTICSNHPIHSIHIDFLFDSDKPISKRVTDIPSDLEDGLYQQICDYMELHPEIWKISYVELLNRIETQNLKRRRAVSPISPKL